MILSTSNSYSLCFQQMPGLKINFDKSEVMILGYRPDEAQLIANRLNCKLGHFPSSYLGIPISDSRLSFADLRPTVSRLQHRIEPWQGRGCPRRPGPCSSTPLYPAFSFS
ncbi:ABC transporter G family member 37 [Hordeum vulgare]|nr:ABC transporter G family member 37 [Hordeum vulgare]